MPPAPPSLSSGHRRIGGTSPAYLIAEIGTGHQGDLVKAQELIHAAAEAGADCAKFQVVFAEEILHPLTGEMDLPGGRIPLFDVFRRLERDQDFYAALRSAAQAAGVDFLASPFGIRSARILRDIGSTLLKIASPELNHLPLLEEVRSYGLPAIVSTGVSRLEDIERALEVLEGIPVALLHCVTAYPAPEEDYNLRILPLLEGLWGVPVGTSDHSLDPVAIPLATVAVGGSLVEKHFCLNRRDPGLDDPIALDPTDFRRMVQGVRGLEALSPPDRPAAVAEALSPQRFERILGTGRKVLAPSERANYGRTNRSLHVWQALSPGHRLTSEDLGVLRTEKVLRPGLGPQFLPLVLGKTLKRAVEAGQGLVWDDLLD